MSGGLAFGSEPTRKCIAASRALSAAAAASRSGSGRRLRAAIKASVAASRARIVLAWCEESMLTWTV